MLQWAILNRMQLPGLPVRDPEGGFAMASARNMVIAGDYTGCRIFCMTGRLAYISGTMKKMDDIFLTPEFG